MLDWFDVQHLDVERLLGEWRWLCPQAMRLVARSAFGDLFLCDDAGGIFRLDVAAGRLVKIADSERDFRELAKAPANSEEWFAAADERASAARQLVPNANQCVAFSIPLVFAESRAAKPYLADIYENVSFLGDLHRQLRDVPDGGKIQLKPVPRASSAE